MSYKHHVIVAYRGGDGGPSFNTLSRQDLLSIYIGIHATPALSVK